MAENTEPAEWAKVVESLGSFGLPPREAALYLALLRRGRATASELAREARVDRVLGYRMLDSMAGRGIVEATAERPRRYAATPPSVLLPRMLRDRREALERDERSASELSTQLSGYGPTVPHGGTRYQVLTGRPRIYDYLREMVARGRSEVSVMLTHVSLRESLEYGLQNQLGGFLARGGRFRMVVESDPRLQQLAGRFQRALRRYPKAEIREISPQPSRLTIVDDSETLVFLVPEARDRRTQQVAIWADGTAFVTGQRLYFDTVWGSARPIGRGRGRRVGSRGPG